MKPKTPIVGMSHMKYSSRNLYEPRITLPLKFKVKVLVEYRPVGRPIEYAPMVFTTDPEAAADEIVRTKGGIVSGRPKCTTSERPQNRPP
jgi:hypothetical protein